jgi:uncharacterized protein YdiU (UPF0061 family)
MNLEKLTLTTPYLELDPIFYDRVDPQPLSQPHFIAYSQSAAKLIGISEIDEMHLVAIINGEFLPIGGKHFAMCYAGHQFGHFVPRLGDGRAINLGCANGWHLQLKGAGQTLYSRHGDGRAVLRSSIREFLMSEAMHYLGIPTTRALGIIGSNEDVARERWEKGSIVLRMSPSWVRFGTFEYFYYANQHDKLEQLADYVIAESYPHLKDTQDAYLMFFSEVVERTAKLIAQWQSVGFNHGVMNTDNMSIAGLTIDYGPYAMLDDYEEYYVCNHTDTEGRYSFTNQPSIAYWNLAMLMRALSPLINIERMEKELVKFGPIYDEHYTQLLRAKLGLDEVLEGDDALVDDLFETLETLHVDHTAFFRQLSHFDGDNSTILALCYFDKPMVAWLERYAKRLEKNSISIEERHAKMLQVNPKYILKNYMLQEAIEKAQTGDFGLVNDLLTLVQTPYDEHPTFERYAGATPQMYKNKKLSCSS